MVTMKSCITIGLMKKEIYIDFYAFLGEKRVISNFSFRDEHILHFCRF
jgi:hypothetical protein